MATIRKRAKANGTFSFQAEIVIKKDGFIVHRESKTFSKQKLAKDWAMRREVELQEIDVYKKYERIPIKRVIELYIKEFNPTGRTKLSALQKLMTEKIAEVDVNKLAARDLIAHAKERNKVVLPQTVGFDITRLQTVIKAMKALINIETDLTVFDSAKQVLRNEGLIASANSRDRIPTKSELLRLSRYLGKPARTCMWFAIYSARRQAEITRLLWSDINHDHKTILVRDLKHPRIKGLAKTAKIPKSAYKIIMKQEKTSDRIFPYNHKTIRTYFHRACKVLDIKDLRFHDLRHAATSFYAAKGLSLNELRLITLHESYASLQRYINLQAKDLDI